MVRWRLVNEDFIEYLRYTGWHIASDTLVSDTLVPTQRSRNLHGGAHAPESVKNFCVVWWLHEIVRWEWSSSGSRADL